MVITGPEDRMNYLTAQCPASKDSEVIPDCREQVPPPQDDQLTVEDGRKPGAAERGRQSVFTLILV